MFYIMDYFKVILILNMFAIFQVSLVKALGELLILYKLQNTHGKNQNY